MNVDKLLNENSNLQAYFWLLFPITLGMGSFNQICAKHIFD